MNKRLLLSILPVLASSPAHAYQVMQAGDIPLRWGQGIVPIFIGLDDGPLVAGSAAAAAAGAIETYSQRLDDMTAGVVVSSDPSSEAPVTIGWVFENWDADYIPEALAVTAIRYDPGAGRILGAEIAVNAAQYSWMAESSGMGGCESAFDLQTVLTHEVGHALGLAHSDVADATMYPSVPPCAMEKRALSDDDLGALHHLYIENPLAAPYEPKNFGCSMGSGRRPAPAAAVLALAAAALFVIRNRKKM